MIQALLQKQPAERIPGAHTYVDTAGYLKCQHCGIAILKRSNETNWNDFINSSCTDEPYSGETIGHETHLLWQLGHRMYFPTQLSAHQDTPDGATASLAPPAPATLRPLRFSAACSTTQSPVP